MLTKNQIITLYDYCKYFRRQARRLADEAAKSRSLGEELQGAIVHEQTRRARELTRLEKALEIELETQSYRSESRCPEQITERKKPAAVHKTKPRSSASKKKSKAPATKKNNDTERKRDKKQKIKSTQ